MLAKKSGCCPCPPAKSRAGPPWVPVAGIQEEEALRRPRISGDVIGGKEGPGGGPSFLRRSDERGQKGLRKSPTWSRKRKWAAAKWRRGGKTRTGSSSKWSGKVKTAPPRTHATICRPPHYRPQTR
ncbi:hypothetical protein H6P81_013908 [Aristolochia fimbriata]|uniref:Uncharacterized protein n=1 Tax=Aristolochia fimbriata TaxID=158543 RepID=A0AAV7EG08_ARIFI|nr:hypothetical protein H6P81_013908 [Aristolochia fimbriata]